MKMKYLVIDLHTGASILQEEMDDEALECLERVEGARVVYRGVEVMIVEME
jgi:hypothetical protein